MPERYLASRDEMEAYLMERLGVDKLPEPFLDWSNLPDETSELRGQIRYAFVVNYLAIVLAYCDMLTWSNGRFSEYKASIAENKALFLSEVPDLFARLPEGIVRKRLEVLSSLATERVDLYSLRPVTVLNQLVRRLLEDKVSGEVVATDIRVRV